MSVDVEIRYRGFRKKKLEIKDILLPGMRYGIMDGNYRLLEGQTGEYTVVYDEKYIGRGYELRLKEEGIELYLSLPTGAAEIRAFYAYVRHICGLMRQDTFLRDGVETDFGPVEEYIEGDVKAGLGALEQMESSIKNGEYKSMYMFGAKNPIAIGERELKLIDHDAERLGSFLHEMQSIDAYYAGPRVYARPDDNIFGVYILQENIRSILPYKPGLLMNHELKVEDWNIILAEESGKQGAVAYEDFLQNVDKSEVYDTEHFILTLSGDGMRKLISRYGKDL